MNALESTMSGQATVTRKAQPANLQAGQPVLHATIHITRAATGKVETYEVVGTLAEEQPEGCGSTAGPAS